MASPAPKAPPETAALVRIFLKMRAARSAIKDEYTEKDDQLKEDMKRVEIELLRRAQEPNIILSWLPRILCALI